MATKKVVQKVVYDHPPLRIAEIKDEATYIHRPERAVKLSENEKWAAESWNRGTHTLKAITKATHIHPTRLYEVLGLDRNDDEITYRDLLEYYQNLRRL